MRNAFLRGCTLVTLLALSGCGGGEPEGYKGTVAIQGKPLAGVTVTLIPESGDDKARLVGSSDREGKFTAMVPAGGKLTTGSFKVVVNDPNVVVTRSGKRYDPRADDPFSADQRVQNPPIPPAYSSEKTTTAKVQLESGKPITIDLP